MPVRRRHKRLKAKSNADSEWGGDLLGDEAMDFTPEELREFLEGDLSEVEVRPEFKERLRKKLWEMVRLQYGLDTPKRDH